MPNVEPPSRRLPFLLLLLTLVCLFVPGLFFAAIFFGCLTTLACFLGALLRLRFSLRTLVLVVLWGGASVTLLTKVEHPALFSVGLTGALLLVAFFIASLVRANIAKEKLDA